MKCSEGCITNLIWQMIQIKIFQESTEQILINSMHLELDVWPMLDTAVGVKEASTLRRCWAWSCSPEALGSRGLCPSSWLQPPASLEMGVGARAPSHHDDAPCTQAGSEGRVTPETSTAGDNSIPCFLQINKKCSIFKFVLLACSGTLGQPGHIPRLLACSHHLLLNNECYTRACVTTPHFPHHELDNRTPQSILKYLWCTHTLLVREIMPGSDESTEEWGV